GWGALIADGSTNPTVAFGTEGEFLHDWVQLTAVVDKSTDIFRIYANGTYKGEVDITGFGSVSNSYSATIGNHHNNTLNNRFNGIIDEVRVATFAYDACWIETEYNNQDSPFTFYGIGGEEPTAEAMLANHAAGQETDKFGAGSSVTGAKLFAFQLSNNTGGTITVNQVQFQLSSVTGILDTDFANLEIQVDDNGDGTIDGSDTTGAVGGTGVVNGSVTTITFSTPFNIAASATINYILKGDVNNLVATDTFTIDLGTGNITLASGTVGGTAPTSVIHTADATGANLTQIHYRWRNDNGGEAGYADWWNSSYPYRQKVTFGTAHSILPLGYTASVAMDTQPSATNVALTSGNDVRVVWQPTAGGYQELDRIGDTWNNASTTIEFRLQSEIGANLDEDVDGSYYIYYGYGSAGTPPTDERNVYYFADFFDRADNTDVNINSTQNWTEWTTGGGDSSIVSGALNSEGNNVGPPDAGVKQTFPLGAIPGDFTLTFDWTLPTNSESTWTVYLNIGNSATMSDGDRELGVGPGIYTGEGAHFNPNLVENVNNDLNDTVIMEQPVNGGPHSIRMDVDVSAYTYDYYRNASPIASGQAFVNNENTLDQIRIANDQYSSGQPAFVYDNLRIVLNVSNVPEEALGTEQNYPNGAADFAAAQDTKLTGLSKGSTIRLRFEVSNEGILSSGGVTYQLQVAETATCGSGSYTAVPTVSTDHWQIVDSSYINEPEATSNISPGLADEATTWVDGELKDEGNTTGSITLAADAFTEIEFAIQATGNATDGGDYCFRLYDTTA
ncbi:MAG: hypothetical protein ACYS21_13670, partial [Planctomycetota bacterium]